MAGQPRAAVTRALLLQMAQDELGDEATVLDFAVHWVSNGGTILGLSKTLNQRLEAEGGQLISREHVRRCIYAGDHDKAERRLALARTRGAAPLAEEALELVDAPALDKVAVAKHKLQADLRLRLAGIWNREEYGEQRGASVVINVAGLHLDALRRQPQTPERILNPTPVPTEHAQLQGAQAVDAEYEIVSEARMPQEMPPAPAEPASQPG